MRSRLALGALIALALAGCHHHQTFPMDGTWARGGISGDHFGQVVMQIADDGTRVTGAVCYWNAGYLIYRDVPVTGQYPRVGYAVPGGHFDGGIIAPDQIQGTWSSTTFQQDWTFRPATAAEYDACRNGLPPLGVTPSPER